MKIGMMLQTMHPWELNEMTERFEALARHGLEHVMLMNISGAPGGQSEAQARAPDFAELVRRLSEL